MNDALDDTACDLRPFNFKDAELYAPNVKYAQIAIQKADDVLHFAPSKSQQDQAGHKESATA